MTVRRGVRATSSEESRGQDDAATRPTHPPAPVMTVLADMGGQSNSRRGSKEKGGRTPFAHDRSDTIGVTDVDGVRRHVRRESGEVVQRRVRR